MLSKGRLESTVTQFKVKHHMVCLNLLKRDKSPHFAKTNEAQVLLCLCPLAREETKVYCELHR